MGSEVTTKAAPRAYPALAWQSWIICVAVAITFFLAARLSLALVEKSDGVAVFWPAAGVATGFLLALGPAARWPVAVGVAAATFAVNLLGDRHLASTLFFVVANAGGPLIVLALVQRFCGTPFDLDGLRRILGFFAATIINAMISGFVGMLGFVFFHVSEVVSPAAVWSHWFASEIVGSIAVAPLAIGIASFLRDAPPKREIAEGALALAIVATICILLAVLPGAPWTFELAVASLCPLFVWIGGRVRPAFMTIAIFMCAITVVSTTIFGIGLFGDNRLPIEERILAAQTTIVALSFGALILAALFSERRMHERAILERERRLEDVLRAGGVITFEWDLKTGLIELSQNAAEILGLGPRQFLAGTEWMEGIHPDDRASVEAYLGVGSADERSHAMTFRFLRPDGRGEVWLEQVAVTHFDSAGVPSRINGLATDITERKRFEDEISRAWRSAALANRAKSSFLSAASHDLRQPLQTLRFLQVALEQQVPDGEGRNLLGGISRSLDTMSSILSSLLDLNRLEAGNLRPLKSDFPINDIFEALTTDLSNSASDKGLRWRVVRSSLLVRSDKRMLEAMIRNLLSNALRYTNRGRILLGCRRMGDNIRIEVMDSGIGITPEQLPHIFEEYYQGASAERGGVGLGLAIVKRLGEMLGHRIDVRSAPGEGTVFSIEVPRGEACHDTPEGAQAPREEGSGFRGTILVVEDEASVRSSISRMLKAKGIEAIVVATANDALDRISQDDVRPDMLICDYNLRGSPNGVETVSALRKALDRDVPAIVMTGDMRSGIVELISAQGVSVLIKPFLVDELLQQLARLTRRPAAGTPN